MYCLLKYVSENQRLTAVHFTQPKVFTFSGNKFSTYILYII